MRASGGVTALAAVVALAYLVAMVVAGAMPRQEQLVKFEARGLMQLPPEQVTRVDVAMGGRKATYRRSSASGSWARDDGTAVDETTSSHLSMAVQMMNTSAAVKTLSDEDLRGVDRTPFGLEVPTVGATLYRHDDTVLEVRFGALNPEGYLQYMTAAGSDQVYLMSRFVAEEWKLALR